MFMKATPQNCSTCQLSPNLTNIKANPVEKDFHKTVKPDSKSHTENVHK